MDLKSRLAKSIRLFPFMLPIVFMLLFFGYATPKFNVTLYTDNIEGEGLGFSYLAPDSSFTYNYRVAFYFGSALKTVTIPDIHYDVKKLRIEISDVTSAEFYGFDVKTFGVNLGYYDLRKNFPVGHYGDEDDGFDTSISEDGKRLHIDFLNPSETSSIVLSMDFLPVTFWIIYWVLMTLITFILSIGASFLWERFPVIRIHVVSAAGIIATMIMGCYICGSLPFVDYLDYLLNFLIFFAVSLLINSLTLPFIGTIMTMAFSLFWYIANFFIIAYRNKPVMPADLKAISTVREVISGYTLTPNIHMVCGVSVVVLYSIISIVTWKRGRTYDSQKCIWVKRGIGAGVAVVILFLCASNPVLSSLNAFQWDAKLLSAFHTEGMALTFLKAEVSARVQKPEGYSREIVSQYLQEYAGTEKKEGIRPTNIIMVMDEAFSDLREIGLSSDIDVMPFIDSLNENVIEGSLGVSVFGGGTCNTEFEALTGNSLAFMGVGAYPYTENITKPMFSLASYFGTLNYDTEAFHPSKAKNWNRDTVYLNFGFDVFHSIEDYPKISDDHYLHGHPADIVDFLYMEDVVEQKTGRPCFLFDVTIQNHSPYERWEDVEKAEGVGGLQYNTQVYLSLVKASDTAVQQLVETYRNLKDPTMIVYFGDHQPGLPDSSYREFSENFGQLDQFKSKFFIWTNYETETQHDAFLSSNYLPWLILERGNFDLPPYVKMLRELHEKYPVLTSQGVIDSDGNVYGNVEEIQNDPLIQKYRYIQYANLFDEIDDAWFTTSGTKQ